MKTRDSIWSTAIAGILLLGALPAFSQVSDTTPPKLVSITISPNSVNVTNAPQTVTVTAHMTDNLSGAAYWCFSFVSPSGTQSTVPACPGLTAGTPLDGTFLTQVAVPQSSEPGTWKLGRVQISDNARNFTFLTTADLQALGLSTDLAVLSTAADTQAPQIVNISFSPATINVSAGPQAITMTMGLTDNLSGVDFSRFLEFRVILRSPSGKQEQYIAGQDFHLISGTPLNGSWQAAHTFPRNAEPGIWSISFLWLSDLADNERQLFTDTLRTLGLATDFNVISSSPDISAPQVTAVTFSRQLIETSHGPATVTVRLTITDTGSGTSFDLDHPNVSYLHGVQFRSPSGNQFDIAGSFSLAAGTPQNGTWQSDVFFPQYSETGTWTAEIIRLKDVVNNFFSLNTAEMATKGFQTQLVIYQPNLLPDGSAGPGGGTVVDGAFGSRAQIQVPSGVLGQQTNVAIDVLSSNLGVPTPAGFEQGSYFVNVDFSPKPAMPLPPPGVTVTLPLQTQKPAGTPMVLYRLDPISGAVPAERAAGCPSLISSVNADGLSATFTCVVRFSTLVAFLATAVPGDVNGDGRVNCADISIVKAAFGKRTGQTGFDLRADLNRDGIVNVVDLGLVSRQLPPGTTCQ